MLTRLCYQFGLEGKAFSKEIFYPIHPDDFWMVLFPDECEDVADLTHETQTLHLRYNNYTRSGYNKVLSPPRGSFLYNSFEKFGTIGHFSGEYSIADLTADISVALPPRKLFANKRQGDVIEDIYRQISFTRTSLKFLLEQMHPDHDCPAFTTPHWTDGQGNNFRFSLSGDIYKNNITEGAWLPPMQRKPRSSPSGGMAPGLMR